MRQLTEVFQVHDRLTALTRVVEVLVPPGVEGAPNVVCLEDVEDETHCVRVPKVYSVEATVQFLP